MSRAEMARVHARRRRTLALICFAALLGLIVLSARAQTAEAEGGGALVAEPVLSATAAGVQTLFGASPAEAPGEIWGVGTTAREGGAIVRYTEASGWETVPNPVDSEGHTLALTRTSVPAEAAAGRTTVAGGVVIAAFTGPINSREPQAVLVRDPGGSFRVAAAPAMPIMETTERLITPGTPIKLAAVQDSDGRTGAFVVPTRESGSQKAVLHYTGSEWVREPICAKAAPATCESNPGGTSVGLPPAGFTVLGIGVTGTGNAWLLARQQVVPSEAKNGHIVLLKREEGQWRPQGATSVTEPALTGAIGSLFARESTTLGGVKVTVAIREMGQPFTVTEKGLWIDTSLTTSTESSDATLFFDLEKEEVTGSWCDLQGGPAAMCARPLGSALPAGEGRSFAWPGLGGPGEEFGTRVITGVGQGAMLLFEKGAFSRIPLDGNGGSSAGAAIAWPEQESRGTGGIEGWLGPSLHLTREPIASGLAPWPVPFRRPLTAVVAQPGAAEGSLEAGALAVGQNGQIARYKPGIGWQAESLLTGSGTVAKPNLRGVAWPEPNFAYAVGDEGAMWLWRASTGLWEPDPGAPTNLIRGNFTGIAFQPGEPTRGYAVGKQGLLLSYGRRWTQEALPAGISPEANITSIAFAGTEALATWTFPVKNPEGRAETTGGLLVNDGSGWRIEEEASKVLAPAEPGVGTVAPRRVAGLPDGGAVIVGAGGGVIEREAAGAPWHGVAGGPVGYPAAVAAIREGGQVRAILSVEANAAGQPTSSLEASSDEAQALGQPQEGQPPLLTAPYPLPKNGYLVRQTATGWRDEQRQSYPPGGHVEGESNYDYPRVPDAVLALLISPDGSSGWAVGGSTGENGSAEASYQREAMQTAGVFRYGVSAAPPQNATPVPISLHPENEAATFAVGGGAACAGPCADLEATGIGPGVWLRAAVGKAAAIPGLRGFLYTGGGVAATAAAKLSRSAFGEEEAAYARRLGSSAGTLPVYAAPATTDLFGGSLASFTEKFAGFQAPLGTTPPRAGTYTIAAGEPAAAGSYEFESRSAGNEMSVRVIVLNEAVMPLGAETQCWLATHLHEARAANVPVLVMGNREVGAETELRRILVTGETAACPSEGLAGAAAYLFESRANREQTLTWGTAAIPAYGTGTLGYINVSQPSLGTFSPASGFILVAVSGSPSQGNVTVTKSLIPNIESLAIEAADGTFLRRSQVALFEALARRPVAGFACSGPSSPSLCSGVSPDPYAKIPARCIKGFENASCASEILPEYEFTSSRPDLANFVKVDPASTNPRAVFLQNGKPVADPKSGLLCAYNAGTTTVTVSTGGLSYSIPVTIQAGSVAQPCGTVPLSEKPLVPAKPTPPPLPPTESSPPHFTQPSSTLPPPNPVQVTNPPPPPVPAPTPTAPQVHHPIQPPAAIKLPFFNTPTPALTPIVVIVPPPPAPAVEPTPPSGTSPVTQPAMSPEPEEEEEAAFDLVHHMSTYRHARARNAAEIFADGSGGGPSLRYLVPALVLLMAMAGAGTIRPRRGTQPLAFETRATPRRRR